MKAVEVVGMTKPQYVASQHLFFVKMTARSIRVGDILKTGWGLREVLDVKIEEGDVWMVFRDNRFVCGEYATVEVLVP
jgi:hypothetical protein